VSHRSAPTCCAAGYCICGAGYLDLDTITVGFAAPALDAPQFIGTEHIVWPHWVRSSRSWAVWASIWRWICCAPACACVRVLARFPACGGLVFQKDINGAVMGGPAGAPLFAADLTAMAALPPARRSQPYALGPDLLRVLVGQFSSAELVIHEQGFSIRWPGDFDALGFAQVQANLDLAFTPANAGRALVCLGAQANPISRLLILTMCGPTAHPLIAPWSAESAALLKEADAAA